MSIAQYINLRCDCKDISTKTRIVTCILLYSDAFSSNCKDISTKTRIVTQSLSQFISQSFSLQRHFY